LYKQFQQILNLLCFSDQELSRCKKACNNQGYRHPWRTCTLYISRSSECSTVCSRVLHGTGCWYPHLRGGYGLNLVQASAG